MRKWTAGLVLVAATVMLIPVSAFAAGTSPSPSTTVVTSDKDGPTKVNFSGQGVRLSQAQAEELIGGQLTATTYCYSGTVYMSRYSRAEQDWHNLSWCASGGKVRYITEGVGNHTNGACRQSSIFPFRNAGCSASRTGQVLPATYTYLGGTFTHCIGATGTVCTDHHGFRDSVRISYTGSYSGSWWTWGFAMLFLVSRRRLREMADMVRDSWTQ